MPEQDRGPGAIMQRGPQEVAAEYSMSDRAHRPLAADSLSQKICSLLRVNFQLRLL